MKGKQKIWRHPSKDFQKDGCRARNNVPAITQFQCVSISSEVIPMKHANDAQSNTRSNFKGTHTPCCFAMQAREGRAPSKFRCTLEYDGAFGLRFEPGFTYPIVKQGFSVEEKKQDGGRVRKGALVSPGLFPLPPAPKPPVLPTPSPRSPSLVVEGIARARQA